MANNNIQKYCKVKGCRFPSFHTTIAHRCGNCNSYGHGQIECRNDILKRKLFVFLEDSMPEHLYCTFPNCTYPWSHSSASHHCFRCGKRGTHSAKDCYIKYKNKKQQFNNNFFLNKNSIKKENIKNKENNNDNITIYKKCPICRESSNINMNVKIFTGLDCIICMEDNKKVIFNKCKHANVCYKCVELL